MRPWSRGDDPPQHVWGNFKDTCGSSDSVSEEDSPAVQYVLQGCYDIRNPGGEDPRLPWLCRTIDWRGKRVLDLGCNAGQIKWAVAAEGAKLTLGVDIDASLIGEARLATSKPAAGRQLNGRVRFRCRDLLRLKLRRKYDVVLLLSTSKRVHLQQLGGSIGLNMTSAKSPLKAFWCLAAGMETRALSNSSGAASDGSVREVADAHADVEKTWGEIQLKPSSFVDFLTEVLGFDRAYRWAFVDHTQESFQRTLYFFWKLVGDEAFSVSSFELAALASQPEVSMRGGLLRFWGFARGYTSNEAAASFTSTAAPLKSKNELRKLTEEEELQDTGVTLLFHDLWRVCAVRKKKQKGYVRMVTSHGCLNLELHCDIAPRTSDNFLRLCEKSYYDNTIFHRLIRNFMLQGGDPTGTGRGGGEFSVEVSGFGWKEEFFYFAAERGRGLKCDQWKPPSREEELRTWREWFFGFTNFISSHDPKYEEDINELDLEVEADHMFMNNEMVERSQRLFGLLCSLLRGRPLLLVRSCEKTKCGYEALRILKNEMEPREKARSLALMRQLAAWNFEEKGTMHEQLVRYEEALRAYEVSAGKPFPEDLVLATLVTGLREPLRSQVQLKMKADTKYSDEWVLQYESLTTPWGFTATGRPSTSQDAPQPMEIDMVKGKDKGWKGKKGKDGKGKKGKDGKTKGKDAKGRPGDGRGSWIQPGKGGWNNNAWSSAGWNAGGWSGKGNGCGYTGYGKGWRQPGTSQDKSGKGKGGADVCNLCGQRGHWKWECPTKGKGKVNQVQDQTPSQAPSSASTSASTSLPSVSLYRGQAGINRIETFQCSTPPGSRATQLFDISGLDDEGEFELDGAGVMAVFAKFLDEECEAHGFQEGAIRNSARDILVYPMDATDDDGDWCLSPFLGDPAPEPPCARVQAVTAAPVIEEMEVVVDSGADISVAPLRFSQLGAPASPTNVLMQDAQGRRIREHGSRVLDLDVTTLDNDKVTIREKFAIANIEAVIVSMGRLLRMGWCLGSSNGSPHIEQGGHRIPVRLRRNTLTVLAMVSAIATVVPGDATHATWSSWLERPGWQNLRSGLPVLVANGVEELDLEKLIWSEEDWPYLAVFVRADPADRKPREGDTWIQALTLTTAAYGDTPRVLSEIDPDFTGRRDVVILFHVEELPRNILTDPKDIFQEDESAYGMPFVPEGEIVEPEGEPMAEEEPQGEELEGIRLHVETPLRVLKGLCDQLGLSHSGGKNKVLKRLKEHHEVLSRQMSAEIARKMFLDSERPPDMPKIPILPSTRQQELHNITHHPFQSWCEACVLGRSKQSPHKASEKDEGQDVKEHKRPTPTIQIDYAYTFTKQKHEVQNEELEVDQGGADSNEGGSRTRDEPGNYQDQHGLTLVGAESTTGWTIALPVSQKGSGSLKRVTEHLVRLSMLIAPGESITFQCDPEAPIKQVVNAVESCRSRLGLSTHKVFIPRGSHASNGLAEKAVNTVRTNGLTLKCQANTEESYSGFVVCGLVSMSGPAHTSWGHLRESAKAGASDAFPVSNSGALLQFWGCKGFPGTTWERQSAEGLCIQAARTPNEFPSYLTQPALRRSQKQPEEQQQPRLWQARRCHHSPVTKLPLIHQARLQDPRLLHPRQAQKLEMEKEGSSSSNSKEANNRTDRRNLESIHIHRSISEPSSKEANSRTDNRNLESIHIHIHRGISEPSSKEANSRTDNRNLESIHIHIHRGRVPWQESLTKRAQVHHRRVVFQSVPSFFLTDPAQVEPEAVRVQVPKQTSVEYMVTCLLRSSLATRSGPTTFWTLWPRKARRAKTGSRAGMQMASRLPSELEIIDMKADFSEVTRLLEMGVARHPREGEDVSGYGRLTTKMVRDWRKRPTWVRRSRLVAREFRAMSDWTAEMFAPASTLATVHAFIAVALSRGLEVAVLDVKDAYLNVPQPNPMIIEVERGILEAGGVGTVELVVDRLLPGQRIGASAWYNFAKDLLEQGSMHNYVKEPTLFRHTDPENDTGLILHADDGMIASIAAEREKLVSTLGSKVKLQVSEPLRHIGDEIEFLKRRYVMVEGGVAVFSNSKYLESLSKAFEGKVKRRDSPSDASFQEPDASKELGPAEARLYRECVGRLLYLSHTRPDVQFATCVLSGRMQSPTMAAMKMLQRVVGYLCSVPEIGFMIRKARSEACFGYEGKHDIMRADDLVVESITDSDWAGCRRTRKSRSSIQLYVAGTLVGTAVRSQRAISLSSGEAEFIALVGGTCEALYLADWMRFLLSPMTKVRVKCRTDSAACRGVCNRLGCGRIRHLHAGLLWAQSAVQTKEIELGSIPGADNPSDIGTKPLNGGRIRELLFLMGAVTPQLEAYGQDDREGAVQKKALSKAIKDFGTSNANVGQVKALLPLLVLLTQVASVQGLSLAAPRVWEIDLDLLAEFFVTAVIGLMVWFMVAGEYVQRCAELQQALSERCREVEACEAALREVREENRVLTQRLETLRRRRQPEELAVAMSRGQRFHLPTCGHIRGKGFKDEFDSRLVHQGPGVLSMANNGKNTNRIQFFVSLKSCEHLNNKHSVFGRVVGGLKLLEVFNNWETDPKDKPVKEIQLVFKNPFKETVEEMNKPKVEKVVDPVATWFSNRKDPMQGHKNRHSTEVGKPRLAAFSAQEMPSEELEYANIAQKSKKARTDFDFSMW
eukprot:s3472_g8.t1